MALVNMVMPKMGESIMEGTILNWLKNPGDSIEQDESVLEVATDKVDTEVPSTHAGVLKEILAEVGQVVPVGSPIAVIETEAEASKTATPVAAPSTLQNQPEKPEIQAPIVEKVVVNRFYSPLVTSMAKKEGISLAELEKLPGTGKDNRFTKKDMMTLLENRQSGGSTSSLAAVSTEVPAPQAQVSYMNNGQDEIIEMDRMRKMIAQRMVDSKRIAPHVTSFVEADVTNLTFWRNRIKNEFKAKEGDAMTLTPIFLEAVIKALKDYPMMNVSVDGDKIIVKKDINIGMAVALPSGNLIVPVIKQADKYNLVGLARKVNELAKKARENKLSPDDLSGGTYTVSNVGSFGNVMGTPILVQPQVGILAVGAVRKKPAVIETPLGDTLGIRHMMFLSHSYDHRVVDGSLGGMFVRRVADYLEQFELDRKLW